jgi:hypothetical protein
MCVPDPEPNSGVGGISELLRRLEPATVLGKSAIPDSLGKPNTPPIWVTMFHFRSVVLIALTLAVVPRTALSQSIGTDRPDFVESSSTVGKGSVQFEGSVAFDQTEELGNWTTPFLFRVGIADAWEFRLESDWFIRSTLKEFPGSAGLTANGVSDLAVGVKWAFFAQETGSAPAMAVLVHTDLPTGSEDFRGSGTRPSLRFVAEWALEGDWGIGVMPGILYDSDDGRRFMSGIFGAVVGKGVTDSLGAFVEIAFEQITEDQHGGNVAVVNFGGTFVLNPRWQLDAAAAVGVTDQAPDVGFTLGLSGLFPR